MSLIENPIQRGQQVIIPAGTIVHSMHPSEPTYAPSKATRTVTIHHVGNGSIQRWDEPDFPRGTTRLPTITWPGSGGYWKTVQVTNALLAANGLDPLALPELDKFARYDLGLSEEDRGLPSLEPGYTNEWKIPTEVITARR